MRVRVYIWVNRKLVRYIQLCKVVLGYATYSEKLIHSICRVNLLNSSNNTIAILYTQYDFSKVKCTIEIELMLCHFPP